MTKDTIKPVKVITDKSALTAAINSIGRRGAKLDRDIQQAAISVMAHHAQHGDVTLINKLVASMPKGSRVNALRAYLESNAAIVYNEETREFDHDRNSPRKFSEDAAQALMWTDFKPEQEYQPISDPALLVRQLVARLNRDRKEAGDASKVDPAMIEALTALTETSVAH